MDSSAGALLFDGEFRDREQQKGARKDVRLQGFDVFVAGFVRALFVHSRFSPVYFTQEAAGSLLRARPPWLQGREERVRRVAANDPAELRDLERLILLSVGPEMIQLAWLRARLRRPDWPVTAVLHSLSLPPRLRYFLTSGLLPLLGRRDALVCPSRAVKKAMESLFQAVPEEVRVCPEIPFEMPVIPFGVDTGEHAAVDRQAARQALGFPPEATVFLDFGRLAPDKCDLLPLLMAFAQLPPESGAVLVLAGDDTQLRMGPALAAVARELGCGERVRVETDVSRQTKLELLAAADVFVSPSENTQESFALTIAEAMASGLPVVSSDWGSHREFVEHGKTGLLVDSYLPPSASPLHILTLYSGLPQENLLAMSTAVDVDQLAAALRLLLERPDLRQEMREAARRRAVETLDWRVVMEQYDDLWSELLRRSASLTEEPGPFRCPSLQDVFAGYPTHALRGEDLVALNDGPASVTARRLPGVLATSAQFSAGLLERLLDGLAAGPQRIERLIATSAEAPHSAADVERHIGRLIKYGILRVVKAKNEA
jgi:glycosyltransferase involved in cell wall biosynthesis